MINLYRNNINKKDKTFVHFCNTKLNIYNKIKWYDTKQTYLRNKYICFKLTVNIMRYYLAGTQLKVQTLLRYQQWLSFLIIQLNTRNARPQIKARVL